MKNLLQAVNLPILLLAGNATLTFESKRTGKHFTYTIREKKAKYNEDPSEYLVLYNSKQIGRFIEMQFHYTPPVLIGSESPEQKVMAWIWKHLIKSEHLDSQMYIYHAGTCVRCGRQLTTPESVLTGIGPECLKLIQKGSM